MRKTLDEAELCFPQLLNSSCRKTTRPHSVSVLIYIVLSCISVLTVTLNLLVIISISHFKKLHTPTNLLLLSLASSDFLVGFLMVFQILLIDGCWYLGDSMCVLHYTLDWVITSASIETMILISIDRYIAICHPLHYSSKVTQERAKICVSLCWIFTLFCVSVLMKDNLLHPGRYNSCAGECVIVADYVAGIADTLLLFVGPVTVIVVLYARVFMVAVSQARAMRCHVAAVAHQRTMRVTVKKSEMKAARSLGVVVVAFLICLFPYFFVVLVGDIVLVSASSVAFFVYLFYCNSCLNPLIYAFVYPWFRKSVRQIVTLQILMSGSRNANIE